MKTIFLILAALPAFGQGITGTPSSGPGSGTVTSIAQGCGEIFSTTPLVATGTISAAGPCLGTGAGTAQVQTATYTPAIAALTNGLWLCWTPSNANSAAAPTFSPDGLTAHAIVKAGGALAANDIITTAKACAIYNTTGTQWELQNPQTATFTIASGTSALGTSAIASGTCATTVTTVATGVATTDNIMADFNASPLAITGYIASTSGMLTIMKWPTSGNVNFAVCNNTLASITPGAVTLNWRVVR